VSQQIFPFQFSPTGSVVFGPGSAGALGKQRALKRAERVLVITDAGVKAAGLLEVVVAGLCDKVALIDEGVVPDGDAAHIEALAERARNEGIDALVALGGGSVMDTAKGVAVLLAKGGRLREHEGYATVRAPLPPLVCVPTTAGTGSESTQFIVVADRELGRKLILTDGNLVPALGVLDPTLLVGLPRAVTAATGTDALAHAIEALGSRMRNPVGTALAIEAARALAADDGLLRCLEEPGDVLARGRVLVAANLAGQAISMNMLGACHAFAHALGALKGVPHGVANGLFLVPVMRMNLEKARPAYAHLGQALGGQGSEVALAEHAIAAVERLVHEVAGVPRRLADVGVSTGDVERLVELTMADPDLATNPVPFGDAEQARSLVLSTL
jgi:alcohol dehydrogenase class IV